MRNMFYLLIGVSACYAILLGATTWSHKTKGFTNKQLEDRRWECIHWYFHLQRFIFWRRFLDWLV